MAPGDRAVDGDGLATIATERRRRRSRKGSPPHQSRDRFGLLLLLIVTAFLLLGFPGVAWARALSGAVQVAAITVASVFSGAARSRLLAAGLVALGAVAMGCSSASTTATTLYGVGSVLAAVTILAIISIVGRRVLRHGEVTIQTLFGATSAYLLIGLFYASVFGAVDAFSTHRLFGEPVAHSVYSYFSFTTLTTLGFGDYAAKSDIGRRIVAVEAMTGQIFLGTALARLVALYRRVPSGARAPDEPGDPTQGSAADEPGGSGA